MKRRIRFATLLITLASLLLLTGCTLGSSVESLFTLPQLPEEYRELSNELERLLDEGYTYVMPTEGPNIESVQMVDLDGDKVKEAVALLQHSGQSEPLKVMVFRQDDGHFEHLCTVEHSGTGIDSINFCDLSGDGAAELLVGWRELDEKKTMSVYWVGHEGLPLMESEYAEYLVQDLSGSGTPGLLLLREIPREGAVAQYYTWQTGIMALSQTCQLSSEIDALSRGSVVGGFLRSGMPVLFVTGVQDKDTATTDILVFDEEDLVNVKPGGISYRYCQMQPQDIDGDGVTELPCRLSEADTDNGALMKDALVSWLRYDAYGRSEKVAETYHCQSYGWYMTWPEEYWSRITVMNGDIISGENCVEFSLEGKPIAALYSITCENRESRAQMGDRFIVTRLPGTIYAAEIYDDSGDGTAITALRESFSLIVNTWDSGGKE